MKEKIDLSSIKKLSPVKKKVSPVKKKVSPKKSPARKKMSQLSLLDSPLSLSAPDGPKSFTLFRIIFDICKIESPLTEVGNINERLQEIASRVTDYRGEKITQNFFKILFTLLRYSKPLNDSFRAKVVSNDGVKTDSLGRALNYHNEAQGNIYQLLEYADFDEKISQLRLKGDFQGAVRDLGLGDDFIIPMGRSEKFKKVFLASISDEVNNLKYLGFLPRFDRDEAFVAAFDDGDGIIEAALRIINRFYIQGDDERDLPAKYFLSLCVLNYQKGDNQLLARNGLDLTRDLFDVLMRGVIVPGVALKLSDQAMIEEYAEKFKDGDINNLLPNLDKSDFAIFNLLRTMKRDDIKRQLEILNSKIGTRILSTRLRENIDDIIGAARGSFQLNFVPRDDNREYQQNICDKLMMIIFEAIVRYRLEIERVELNSITVDGGLGGWQDFYNILWQSYSDNDPMTLNDKLEFLMERDQDCLLSGFNRGDFVLPERSVLGNLDDPKTFTEVYNYVTHNEGDYQNVDFFEMRDRIEDARGALKRAEATAKKRTGLRRRPAPEAAEAAETELNRLITRYKYNTEVNRGVETNDPLIFAIIFNSMTNRLTALAERLIENRREVSNRLIGQLQFGLQRGSEVGDKIYIKPFAGARREKVSFKLDMSKQNATWTTSTMNSQRFTEFFTKRGNPITEQMISGIDRNRLTKMDDRIIYEGIVVGSHFNYFDFSRNKFNDTRFENSKFLGNTFNGTEFTETSFGFYSNDEDQRKGVCFVGTKFERVKFDQIQRMTELEFRNCSLNKTNFDKSVNAVVYKVKFTGTGAGESMMKIRECKFDIFKIFPTDPSLTPEGNFGFKFEYCHFTKGSFGTPDLRDRDRDSSNLAIIKDCKFEETPLHLNFGPNNYTISDSVFSKVDFSTSLVRDRQVFERCDLKEADLTVLRSSNEIIFGDQGMEHLNLNTLTTFSDGQRLQLLESKELSGLKVRPDVSQTIYSFEGSTFSGSVETDFSKKSFCSFYSHNPVDERSYELNPEVIRDNGLDYQNLVISFRNCKLRNVKFDESIMIYVNFEGSVLENCSFKGTDLQVANFNNCTFKNCNFNNSNLEGAQTDGINQLEGNTFENATGVERTNFHFSGAKNYLAYLGLTDDKVAGKKIDLRSGLTDKPQLVDYKTYFNSLRFGSEIPGDNDQKKYEYMLNSTIKFMKNYPFIQQPHELYHRVFIPSLFFDPTKIQVPTDVTGEILICITYRQIPKFIPHTDDLQLPLSPEDYKTRNECPVHTISNHRVYYTYGIRTRQTGADQLFCNLIKGNRTIVYTNGGDDDALLYTPVYQSNNNNFYPFPINSEANAGFSVFYTEKFLTKTTPDNGTYSQISQNNQLCFFQSYSFN